MIREVLGVILGGGQGQRLYPLTKLRSKPAVPMAGKYRIIDIPVSNCLNSGINKIFVLTQFNSASLNRHIMQTYQFDLFGGGFVDVLAAEQTPDNPHWFQGTADAVRQIMRHIDPYEDVKYVTVLSGDQLYQMDLREMLKLHIESSSDITLGTFPVTREGAAGMGIMKIQPDGRVVEFREKPKGDQLLDMKCSTPLGAGDPPREYLASMGIYFFNKVFLNKLLTESTAVDFGKELIPQSISKYKVTAYVFDGYWTDIGTVRSFYEANLELTGAHSQFDFYQLEKAVYTHRRNLPGSKLNNCSIHQSIITEGCILSGADIKHSVIGVRSRIGSGTTIKNSIVMGADRFEKTQDLEENKSKKIPNMGVGNHCTIINAIVDKNTRIGDNVSIINAHNVQEMDAENYNIRDGIIVVPKGAVIPPNTVI